MGRSTFQKFCFIDPGDREMVWTPETSQTMKVRTPRIVVKFRSLLLPITEMFKPNQTIATALKLRSDRTHRKRIARKNIQKRKRIEHLPDQGLHSRQRSPSRDKRSSIPKSTQDRASRASYCYPTVFCSCGSITDGSVSSPRAFKTIAYSAAATNCF